METVEAQLVGLRAVAERMRTNAEMAHDRVLAADKEEDKRFWIGIDLEATTLLLQTLEHLAVLEKLSTDAEPVAPKAAGERPAEPSGVQADDCFLNIVTVVDGVGKPILPEMLAEILDRNKV